MSGHYTLSGVDLRRWRAVRGTTYRAPVSTRRTSVAVPGRHGDLAVGRSTYATPTVVIELRPGMAQSAAALETLNDDLAALGGSQGLTVRRAAAGTTREASARLVSMDWDTTIDWGIWSGVTLVLELPNVFFRDTTFQTLDVPAGPSTHTVLAGSAPIIDAVVRWEWATAPQPKSLVDVTTGTGVSVDPAISSGTYVYIDAGALQAWRANGSAQWDRPAGSWEDSRLDYPGPGPLQLWPAVRESGGNLIREVRLQASHPCTIRYRRSWL